MSGFSLTHVRYLGSGFFRDLLSGVRFFLRSTSGSGSDEWRNYFHYSGDFLKTFESINLYKEYYRFQDCYFAELRVCFNFDLINGLIMSVITLYK